MRTTRDSHPLHEVFPATSWSCSGASDSSRQEEVVCFLSAHDRMTYIVTSALALEFPSAVTALQYYHGVNQAAEHLLHPCTGNSSTCLELSSVVPALLGHPFIADRRGLASRHVRGGFESLISYHGEPCQHCGVG